MKTLASILIFLIILSVTRALTQEMREYEAESWNYKWDEEARRVGLAEEDIKHLAQNKIIITNETFKQVFEPYLEPPNWPMFITSDSLLNAFHVLYEESFFRLETASARKLPDILSIIWDNLSTIEQDIENVKPELVKAAKTRAQIIIGTALKLMGDEKIKPDKEITRIINEEMERIMMASDVIKPKWLGPPDEGFMALDYSRYKPRGFYTKLKELEGYFRATSWLQSIPFRVSLDEELLSILMLGNCSYDFFNENTEYETFFRAFSELIGIRDDWDIIDAAQIAQNKSVLNNLAWMRERLMQEATRYGEGANINDQIVRFPPLDAKQFAEVSFRIMSACRTPDATLFQRTTDLRTLNHPFPTGLEVCVALGSSYAKSKLSYSGGEVLLSIIDKCRPYFSGSSLYFSYLNCLRALLDEPEPDAPAFMLQEPWRVKSCQTALSGWAQLRHTFVLQAKQTAHYGGVTVTMLPPGFVEPEPEFFARMANMVENAEETFRRAGVFEFDMKEHEKKIDSIRPIPPPTIEEFYIEELNREFRFVEPLWERFGSICRRLETLAHKQLRRVPFSSEENNFIEEYGAQVAGVMLYGGNSYEAPLDDAPRIADVFYNPNVGKYLQVGIARPRALYVLYPFGDGEILCKGTVMPYYEFQHPTRMTDAEWKEMLDSEKCPDIPDWVKPIIGSREISKPEMMNDKEIED